MDIQVKINEFQQRQAELIALLQVLQQDQTSDPETKRIKLKEANTELSAVSFQLSRLYAAIPLADGAKEVLESLPTVDNLRNAAKECADGALHAASGFLHTIGDKLSSLATKKP